MRGLKIDLGEIILVSLAIIPKCLTVYLIIADYLLHFIFLN